MRIKSKNNLDVTFLEKFDKQLKSAPDDIKEAFAETLDLFLDDPTNPFLRNHALREKFAGYRSINVTDDWRAVFKEVSSEEHKVITFHLLGTHKDLYGTPF